MAAMAKALRGVRVTVKAIGRPMKIKQDDVLLASTVMWPHSITLILRYNKILCIIAHGLFKRGPSRPPTKSPISPLPPC